MQSQAGDEFEVRQPAASVCPSDCAEAIEDTTEIKVIGTQGTVRSAVWRLRGLVHRRRSATLIATALVSPVTTIRKTLHHSVVMELQQHICVLCRQLSHWSQSTQPPHRPLTTF